MSKHDRTPGKWRGLKATSSADGTFSILAFDQRGNYRAMLPPEADFATAARIKAEVITGLAAHVTAVLLDPIYGLEAALALPGNCGLLMAVEKTGYAGSAQERRVDFHEGWDVAAIRRMGASAVKLLVYYHPFAGTVTDDIDATVARIAAECQTHDIPLFVEPLSYSTDESIKSDSAAFAAERPQIVIETARRLSQFDIDVLKMEFPVNIAYESDETVWRSTCEALTDASRVPWTLLSAGVDFEAYARQVDIACQSGASGFVGGRAIWREAITMTQDERHAFLADTGARRTDRLREIVARSARPWTDLFAPTTYGEHWYEEYNA
jgi:tagatose 1,6-diphosphate aldolase